MTVNIELISQTDLADESFYIAINGLEPRAMYCVEMYLSDYYCINAPLLLDHDVIWKSTAIFLSDQDGMIDTSQTASISGSYKGISEMGLFFNAKPLKNRKRRLSNSLDRIPLRDYFGVEIKIRLGKDVVAEQSFVRRFMNLGIRYQDIYDKHFQGRLFYNEKLRRAPAVIIVSGSEGRIEKAQNIAQLLSSRGYICLAIAYFGLEGLPHNLERIPIECLEEAKDFLYHHPQVDNTKIGIYGRSKGAELVLAGQSILEDVQCLVLNSPSNVIFEGIKGKLNSHSSSWTYLQKELPYQKFQLGNYLLNKFFGKQIPEDSSAQIDVSKIASPVLLLGSDVDEIWNASSAIDGIISHYKGKSILFKKYHETGHMLTVAYQPNHRYRKNWCLLMKESVDSWFATINFFDRYLKNL
ncbi:acyl-CoA thioesterase/BAAT N-terminal domain-containing protein [Streptococcus mitis]|uniref:acyl-CoA thioesterase/BAAT N-terminal domain-containing protein n=1 Tax=Streptococcus mitis TaxID=28037 RepID=UPI0021B7D689|nr:acyl-CoA thioesterase/bile acid-CoA:amino acid N-acyltransferase family protein [Streptococcus mitis]